MAMLVRYSGAFYSRKGVVWRCDILQETDTAFKVGRLRFPDKKPLVVEYDVTAKEEVVCGSTATLTVVSPGDRTYLDLYTIKPGQIRLDVYRNGSLFWSGCLDPEFYEEPYDSDSDYEVSLTFSDFGILDRIPYDGSGRKTLKELLDVALGKSGLNYAAVDESLISTQLTDGTPLVLSSLKIASENFYDEDGVASSYREVIEGIFQPLGLKMIQRSGKVFVYDINALHGAAGPREIVWQRDGALGTDSVYNNIKITFSPYSAAEVIDGELDYGDVSGPEWTNLTSDSSGVKYNNGIVPSGKSSPECYSYYIDYDDSHKHGYDWDYSLIGFTIFLSRDTGKCPGLAEIGSGNSFFKIQPMLGGNETEGVVGGFCTGGHGSLSSGYPKRKGLSPESHPKTLAMRTARAYLPDMEEADAANSYLRIEQELLFDPRYNPFEQSGDGNESGNCDFVQNAAAFVFVPVAIVVYDEGGTALCHYSNEFLTQWGHPGNSFVSTARDGSGGRWGWKDGEAEWGEAWLAYYDPDDLLSGTGVMGWQCNRQSVGKPWTYGSQKVKNRVYKYLDMSSGSGSIKDFWMFDSFKKLPDGQFIHYPPKGGYLEIRVYNGVWAFDDTDMFDKEASGYFSDKKGYGKIRWQLYKLPRVSVVKRTLTLDGETMDDVEYSGVLNADAKEGLEIDTVCGTADVVCPTAKGIYLSAENGEQIQKLTRAGRTAHPEQLLIGTLYSQYADRRTTLSGEVDIDPDGLSPYADPLQGEDVRFIMSGETVDAKEDTSEATFTEIRPDEYEGREG